MDYVVTRPGTLAHKLYAYVANDALFWAVSPLMATRFDKDAAEKLAERSDFKNTKVERVQ